MTNNEMVWNARTELLKSGMIHGVMVDGKELPEELYTFDEWKKQGRIVKKGEHAIHKMMLWVPTKQTQKLLDDNDGKLDEKQRKSARMKLRMSSLFTKEQTEPSEEAERKYKERAEERAKAKKADKKESKKVAKTASKPEILEKPKKATAKKSAPKQTAKTAEKPKKSAKAKTAKKATKATTETKQGEQMSVLPVPVKSKAELKRMLKDDEQVYVKYTKNPYWKDVVGVERKIMMGDSTAIYIQYKKADGTKSSPRLDYKDFTLKDGKLVCKFDENRQADVYTK